MFKVEFNHTGVRWIGGEAVTYSTEALAWRAVHEMLEEAFGDDYTAVELALYRVVPTER